MNYSALIELLNADVQGVGVQFLDNLDSGSESWVYKSLLPDLKIGDLVVVPSGRSSTSKAPRIPYSIARVVKLDAEIDHESGITYKWLVSKIDLEPYELVLERERVIIEIVKRTERQDRRDKIRKALAIDTAVLVELPLVKLEG